MYVAKKEGSATYHRWYYEAVVDHIEQVTHLAPHIRLGWANTEGYLPYPGGGQHWGANGVGDDLYSYGFDGVNLWTGIFDAMLRES
jgi:ryanodine receptor 2